MAEFRKLSEVEKVESVKDSATVLIEENGVIKRAPKDEVGGIVKEEPDMILKYDAYLGINIVSGNHDAIMNKIMREECPTVIVNTKVAAGHFHIYGTYNCAVSAYDGTIYLTALCPVSNSGGVAQKVFVLTENNDISVGEV